MPAASYFCNGDERQHNSSLSEEKWQVSDFDLQTTRRELSYLFMYESSLEMEKRASKILKKKKFPYFIAPERPLNVSKVIVCF